MRIIFHIGKPATTSKSVKAPCKSRKPTKPSEIDCDNDHHGTAKDDKTVTGTLVVKSCHSSRFARKPSRCSNVGDKFSSLLNDKLAKVGITDKHNVKIEQTTGDNTQTVFHYPCPCEKAHQQAVINSLKDAC